MTYLWSDAWLLQAIALASQEKPARLGDILGAADAVNHALPTDDELHGALTRLTAGGFVEEADAGFQLTPGVPPTVADALVHRSWTAGRAAASAFLGAEPWTPDRNIGDRRNQVTYAGLTPERIRDADEEYRRRIATRRRRRRADE
jgi:hypothetical protein